MTRIEFTVPARPVAQPRARFSTRAGFVQVHTPTSRKRADGTRVSTGITEFKTDIRHYAAAAYRGAPLLGPIRLTLLFIMPRPKGMIWKTKPMPRVPHTVKPDLDNLEKSVKDALKELAWKDDAQVWQVQKQKFVAAGDEQPFTHVIVEAGE